MSSTSSNATRQSKSFRLFVVLLLVAAGFAWIWWSEGDPAPPVSATNGGSEPMAAVATTTGTSRNEPGVGVRAPSSAADTEPIKQRPPLSEGLGGLVIRTKWRSTGLPAPKTRVRVSSAGVDRTETTDESGELLVAELPPDSRYQVMFDVWSARHAQVLADRWTVVELPLADPAHVTIEVVDPQDRPAASAKVALSGEAGRLGQAETDDQGRCRFERVPCNLDFFVDHPRGSVAHYIGLLQPGDHVVKLKLQLSPASANTGTGSVEFLVLDWLGKPLAEAKANHRQSNATTDERGRCRLDGIPIGKRTVWVLRSGYAPEQLELEVQPGVASHTVELRPLATVRVTVRAHGEPVRHAVVIPQGKLGIRTDREGRATFVAPPGENRIHAWHSRLGKAKVALKLEPGQAAEWIAELDAGRQVRGRVLDVRGQAIPDLLVRGSNRESRTDERGRFHLVDLPEGKQRIAVHRGIDLFDDMPLAHREVEPDGPPIELRIDPDAQRATIRGQLVFAELEWRSVAQVQIYHELGSRPLVLTADGSFAARELPAGSYQLIASAHHAPWRSGTFARLERNNIEVAAGETKDLGKLRLEAPCRSKVVLRGRGSWTKVSAWLWRPDGSYAQRGRVGPEGLVTWVGSFPPGRYTLAVEGEGLHPVRRKVDFLPDSPNEVEVTVRSGVRRTLVIDRKPLSNDDTIRATVRAGTRLVYRTSRMVRYSDDWAVWLAPGTYSVELKCGECRCRLETSWAAKSGDPIQVRWSR